MIRERLAGDLKEAIKAKDAVRVSTLRLVSAAIKDRDIAARGEDNAEGVTDGDILAILGKMIRQRDESAGIYEQAGRLELATRERAEIEVIRSSTCRSRCPSARSRRRSLPPSLRPAPPRSATWAG